MNDEKGFMVASLINSLVKSEWDAVEDYNNAIATLSDQDGDEIDGIIANLEDIRDEEYVHIGQLQSCLAVLNNDPIDKIDSGAEEGEGKLELPEEDGEEEDEEIEDAEGAELEEPEDSSKLEIESLKESGGERFDWDITDEVNREYERITKKFPNITDDELEDRLYSSIANILSGWQMENKGETIDNIINTLMNEKRRAISTEDVSTKEMKKVICSMINEYDASEEEVYDELSSATPDVSRDLVHRLYQMCSGNKEEPQQETSFEDFWNEMEDTEEY